MFVRLGLDFALAQHNRFREGSKAIYRAVASMIFLGKIKSCGTRWSQVPIPVPASSDIKPILFASPGEIRLSAGQLVAIVSLCQSLLGGGF